MFTVPTEAIEKSFNTIDDSLQSKINIMLETDPMDSIIRWEDKFEKKQFFEEVDTNTLPINMKRQRLQSTKMGPVLIRRIDSEEIAP